MSRHRKSRNASPRQPQQPQPQQMEAQPMTTQANNDNLTPTPQINPSPILDPIPSELNQQSENQPASPGTIEGAPDFRALAGEFSDQGAQPQTGVTASPAGVVMDRATFHKTFQGMFGLGSNWFKSLAIKPDEQASANAACDAIYDSALEVEWLKFLIQPGNVWVGRILAIAMFTGPKLQALRAEIEARQSTQDNGIGAHVDPARMAA
jgi:hypothetical protein